MKRINSQVIIVSFLIVISLGTVSFSQIPQIAKPLSLEQITALVKNTDPVVGTRLQDLRVSREIENRDIDFEPSAVFLDQLERQGKFPKTVATLRTKFKEQKAKNSTSESPRKNVKVLIADFYNKDGQNRAIRDTIKQKLEEATNKYPEIQIVATSQIVDSEKGSPFAKQLGEKEHADLVLWGWYTTSDTTAMVSVNFETMSNVPYIESLKQTKLLRKPKGDFDNFSFQIEIAEQYSAVVLLTLGLISEEQDNPELAIKHFSDAMSITGISKEIRFQLYLQRGWARFQLAQNRGISNETESISDLKEAIDLEPTNFYASITLAQMYLTKGQSGDAFPFRQNFTKGQPGDALPLLIKAYELTSDRNERIQILALLALAYEVQGDETRTKQTYERMISESSLLEDQSFRFLLLGALAVERGSYEDSRSHFSEVFKLSKDKDKQASTYMIMGASFGLEGDNIRRDTEGNIQTKERLSREAEKCLKMAAMTDPENPYYHYVLSEFYNDRADYDAAIVSLNEAIRLRPKSTDYYIKRGQIYEEKKDFVLALKDFEKAVAIDVKSRSARIAKASYHQKRKEYSQAIKEYEVAISIEDRADTRIEKAKVYDAMKEPEKALVEALLAVKTNPNYYIQFFGPNNQKDITFSHKVRLDAIEKLFANEKSPYLLLEQAKLHLDSISSKEKYFEDIKYKTAISDFNEAFSSAVTSPEYNKSEHIYAICYTVLSEFEIRVDSVNGLAYSKKCLDFLLSNNADDGNLGTIYSVQGQINSGAKRIDKAIEDYTNVIKYTDYYPYRRDRAKMYVEKGSFDEAIRDMDIAIKYAPSVAESYRLRGEIFWKMKKFEDARKDFLAVLKISASNFDWYFEKAAQYRKGTPFVENVNALNRLIAMDNSPYLHLELGLLYLSTITAADNYFGDRNYITAVAEFDEAMIFLTRASAWSQYKGCSLVAWEFGRLGNSKNGIRVASGCIDRLRNGKLDRDSLAEMFNIRGVLNSQAGEHRQAIVDFSMSVTLAEQEPLDKERSAAYRFNRADEWKEIGAMDKALDDLNISIRIGGDAGSYYARALILIDQDKKEGAISDLKIAIEKASDPEKKKEYTKSLNELLGKPKNQ